MLGVVNVGLATVVASVDAPVIVPDPLIVIVMIYLSTEDGNVDVAKVQHGV